MTRWIMPGGAALLVAASLAGKEGPAKDQAANWPQWRGPSGQGYSDDKRVPLTWGEKDNLLWKTRLPGGGNSTPIVWGVIASKTNWGTGASPSLFEDLVSQNCDNDGGPGAAPAALVALDKLNRLGEGTTLDFGASPAVANGRLFLRSQSYLYRVGEKK
jgi:hypothetical protein